ncbi:MAG: fatty acid desaturase family protein [Chitinophagales bacterium]
MEIISTFEQNISQEEKVKILREVKKLSTLNSYKSVFAILSDWLIIAATIIIAVSISNILLTIISIFIIGSRQHALLLLMHEAAHYRLTNNKNINQFLSDFFCAFPLFVTTNKYRDSHLAHHKYLNTEKDPDWMLKKGLEEWEFPKQKREVLLLYVKHLFGLKSFDFLKKIYRFGAKNKSVTTESDVSKYYKLLRVFYYAILYTIITLSHSWKIYLLYWIVPAFTVLPFLLRLRGIAEHFGLSWKHELNNARNVTANVFEQFFLVQHNANYHLDHHLFPSVPFYNLKKLHAILEQNRFYVENASNTSSYLLNDSVFNEITQE